MSPVLTLFEEVSSRGHRWFVRCPLCREHFAGTDREAVWRAAQAHLDACPGCPRHGRRCSGDHPA